MTKPSHNGHWKGNRSDEARALRGMRYRQRVIPAKKADGSYFEKEDPALTYAPVQGRRRFVDGCKMCEHLKEEYEPGCVMPYHDSSKFCEWPPENGHCTCDYCF